MDKENIKENTKEKRNEKTREKMLFFYGSFGGGHKSAIDAILDQVKDSHNLNIKIYDILEYLNPTFNKISISVYNSIIKYFPYIWKWMYNSGNNGIVKIIGEAQFRRYSEKLYELIKKENPKYIISTHPFSSSILGYIKSKYDVSAKIFTIITDFEIQEQWIYKAEFIDGIFVATEEMKNKLMQRGVSFEKIFVTGIPIRDQFLKEYSDEEKNEIKHDMDILKNKKVILFFGGGALGIGLQTRSFLEKILEYIQKNNNIHLIVVSGKNEKKYYEFESIINKYNLSKNVSLIKFSTEVNKLLSISNIVISKPGGLTLSESIKKQVPIFTINAIPGQEEANERYIESQKIGKKLTLNDVQETFDRLFSKNEIKVYKENYKKIANEKMSDAREILNIIMLKND